MHKIKIFFFYFLLFFLALSPNFGIELFFFGKSEASALEIVYPRILGLSVGSGSSFTDFAAYFFNIGMALASSLAALVILIGGAMWIVSFSQGKIQQSGKDWVKSGVLGLILLLASYTMVYTINPNLVIFGKQILRTLHVNPADINQYQTPPVPQSLYNEIPIGTFTENLMARQINCFDFDVNGEPVDGDPATPDIIEPSLKDHDRIDCILKLAEAIQRKAKIASDLSDEIKKLMDSCKCVEDAIPGTPAEGGIGGACMPEDKCIEGTCVNKICVNQNAGGGAGGKCKLNCDENDPEQCKYTGGCPGGWCTGDCVNTGCKAANNIDSTSCCSDNVKKKTEHGPITLPQESNCTTPTTPSNGSPVAKKQNIYTLGAIISAANPNTEIGINTGLLAYSAVNNFLAVGGDSVTPPAPPKITSISISPEYARTAPGKKASFSVSGTDENGNSVAVSAIIDADSGAGCAGPVCTPTAEGSYTITARLEDDYSIQARATLEAEELSVSINGPTSALVDSEYPSIYFAQADGGDGNYTYNWSGENCGGQNGADCSTYFNETGAKKLTVTVTDGQGNTKTFDITVMVNTFETAGCSASTASVKPGEPVTFTAYPGGGREPYIFSWTLPEGASKCSEGDNESETCKTSFSKKGTYSVKISITYDGSWYRNNATCTIEVADEGETPSAKIEYKGLDEFRGEYTTEGIISEVEVPNGGEYDAATWKQLLANKISYDDKILVIDNNVWKKMRLIDKIKYLKEKMKLFNLDGDLRNLTDAKKEINNCYDVKSYVDYLKLATETDKKDKIISSQDNYRDPIYNYFISIARYCKGYEYGNAQCFQSCQKSCGPVNQASFEKLTKCPACSGADCSNAQICIQNAINNATCSSGDAGATFQGCMDKCKKTCNDDCSKKYPSCSEDLKNCQKQCDSDSTSFVKTSGGK